MRKSIGVMLCLALVALNAAAVFANVSPYESSQVSVQPASVRVVGARSTGGCNLELSANPADVYFFGQARRECVDKNKYNVWCQQQCFDKIKLMAVGQTGREMGVYSRYGCKDVDAMMSSTTTASQCYFQASTECAKANVYNDYCRKKCAQKAMGTCRQNRRRAYGL